MNDNKHKKRKMDRPQRATPQTEFSVEVGEENKHWRFLGDIVHRERLAFVLKEMKVEYTKSHRKRDDFAGQFSFLVQKNYSRTILEKCLWYVRITIGMDAFTWADVLKLEKKLAVTSA